MTVHSDMCDGWYYVGKGNLPDPGDDSVYCTGQCVSEPVTQTPQEIAQERADHHGKIVRAYELGGSVTYWVGAAPGSRQYKMIAEAFPTKDES